MLYLLKASRIAEYRRENVDILSASEGDRFSVSYGRRWMQDGLTVGPDTGGVIVFADSPYTTFVPVRFCVIDDVDDVDTKVTITGRLGPFVDAAGARCLTDRWAGRQDDERPGRRFLFEDDNPGLHQPTAPAAHEEAWRTVVDALGENPYFASTTAVQVRRVVDAGDVPLDPAEPLEVGAVVTVELELRTPAHEIETVEPVLDTTPRGSAELVAPPALPANGTATVDVRLLAPGELRTRLALKPEPLMSSRPTLGWTVAATASVAAAPHGTEPPAGAARVDMGALLHHLRREAAIDHLGWIRLHEDVLLPADPDSVELLSDYAEQAAAADEHAKAHDALVRLADRTPEQNTQLLVSGLRSRRDIPFGELFGASDFSSDRCFPDVVDAVAGAEPATVHHVLQLLLEDQLSDDKLLTLATATWGAVTSVEVMHDVLDTIAYQDPDAGLRLLTARWPDPAVIPDRLLDLILDWGVPDRRVTAYHREALRRAAERGDWDTLANAARQVSKHTAQSDVAGLLAFAGRYLLSSAAHRDEGATLLVDSTYRAVHLGEFDLALDTVPTLEVLARTTTAVDAAAVEQLASALDEAVDSSEELRRWEEFKAAGDYDRLRPHFRGKVLHFCGGAAQPWAPDLRDGLGLADLRWHETDKHGSNHADWSKNLTDRDIVILVTTNIGHAISGTVKQNCDRQGVPCYHGSRFLRQTLKVLQRVAQPARD
ncbi:MAG: hypothetical protein JJU45_14695 [Acidimicrobiia bacterium]|nr:hypothetical protein [Acidimicrobiia bacterium]